MATSPKDPQTIHWWSVQNQTQANLESGVAAGGTPTVNTEDTLAAKPGHTNQGNSKNDAA